MLGVAGGVDGENLVSFIGDVVDDGDAEDDEDVVFMCQGEAGGVG
jgi:hypothetical protein